MPIFDPSQVPKSPEDYPYSDYYNKSTHNTTPLTDILI